MESVPYTMNMTQGTELQVCRLARNLAEHMCERVIQVKMHNLLLPMQYIVRLHVEKGKMPFARLYKVGADEVELPVNDDNPLVGVCLTFYKDVKAGFIEQVEEAYCKRAREFAKAELFLTKTLEEGISSRYQTPDLDNLDAEGEDIEPEEAEPTIGRIEKLDVQEAPRRVYDF